MRVSAIRFGADLWQLLEQEAARVGVSVAQYVREASLARASAAAAARGEDIYELLGQADPTHGQRSSKAPGSEPRRQAREDAEKARAEASQTRSGAQALKAQSKQAVRRAQQLGR